MQSLFSRALFLLAGLFIGVLGVTVVLVLVKSGGASSSGQSSTGSKQFESQSEPDPVITKDSMSNVRSDSLPSDIQDLVFPALAFNRKASILSWVAVLSDDQIVNWLEQSIEPRWDIPEVYLHELQSALIQKLSTTSPQKALNLRGLGTMNSLLVELLLLPGFQTTNRASVWLQWWFVLGLVQI